MAVRIAVAAVGGRIGLETNTPGFDRARSPPVVRLQRSGARHQRKSFNTLICPLFAHLLDLPSDLITDQAARGSAANCRERIAADCGTCHAADTRADCRIALTGSHLIARRQAAENRDERDDESSCTNLFDLVHFNSPNR
jgi:cytochrome c553